MRSFGSFEYRGASYKISPAEPGIHNIITSRIVAVREELEDYIVLHPDFLKSLVPIELLADAPEAAVMMSQAAHLTGIGPMAAVAGSIAQLASVQAAEILDNTGKAPEIIIENGGDIFILPESGSETVPVIAGIFSGIGSGFDSLALKIMPGDGGTAVCSSSSRMGHSLSLGDCDLCTAFSPDAALADAAATLGGNLVKTDSDLALAAEHIAAIKGVTGVLIIRNGQISMAGRVPELVRHADPRQLQKITGTFFL